MSAGTGRLSRQYEEDHNKRHAILETARQCAALTKPWILTPHDQDPHQRLPEPYQSLGARILSNLEGKLLLSLYGLPWFRIQLAAAIQYDPAIPDEAKQEAAEQLFMVELTFHGVLESASLENRGHRKPNGFRTGKRSAISQILGTGETLQYLNDDYRLRIYRRDQYVNNRNGEGDVIYHTIKEKKDPLELDPEQLEAGGFESIEDLQQKTVSEREVDLYTHVEWQPQAKNWLIRQEANDRQINESQEPITPYFNTTFELAPGEHYGRGFIEQNLGDLRSHDNLRERFLDWAAAASKMHPVLDENSNLRDSDLEKQSGRVLRGKVRNGAVQDIGTMMFTNMSNFQVVEVVDAKIRDDLAAAGLLESEAQPEGERVTAYQVRRIAAELEGALGGVYASIADEDQVPLLERTMYQLKRDNLIPDLPDDAVEYQALTGLAAMGREVEKSRVMELVQAAAALGPEAMQKINSGVLVDLLARYNSIYEPGLIKSTEQMQAELQQAQQQQAMQQAQAKAIDAAGNVAEQQMTQQ